MKLRMVCIMAGLAALLAVGCDSAKDSAKESVIIAKEVEYDVFISNYRFASYYALDPGGIWDRENIEAPYRKEFIRMLFEKAASGAIKITDLQGNAVDSAGFPALISKSDTQRMTRPYPPYDEFDTVVNTSVEKRLIVALRFREEWTYDPHTMAISKKVLAYAPMATTVSFDDRYREVYSYPKPLFWVICDGEKNREEILTRRIIYSTAYTGDITPASNLDSLQANTYWKRFFELAYSDSIAAYTYAEGDMNNLQISGADLYAELNSSDTIRFSSGEPPVTKDTVVKNSPGVDFDFRFCEEWSFDPNTMAIYKKVNGLCPLVQEWTADTREFRGYRPLFWVYWGDVWVPYQGKLKLKKL